MADKGNPRFASRLDAAAQKEVERIKLEKGLSTDKEVLDYLIEVEKSTKVVKTKDFEPISIVTEDKPKPSSKLTVLSPRGHWADFDDAYENSGLKEILKRIGYKDYPLIDPPGYVKPAFPLEEEVWYGAQSVRTRGIIYPVGNHYWTTEGWKAYPWFIPQCRIEEFWEKTNGWRENGFIVRFSKPLHHDWAGNGCSHHANRRCEVALRGDVVPYVMVDMDRIEQATQYLKKHSDVPCFVKVDFMLYNDDDRYFNLVNMWNDFYSYYYEKRRPMELTSSMTAFEIYQKMIEDVELKRG